MQNYNDTLKSPKNRRFFYKIASKSPYKEKTSVKCLENRTRENENFLPLLYHI